jgi:apolipoprotein D and lipocalin family protein
MAAMAAAAPATANQPVPELDLARYSGSWHEIAHLPMFFQRKCTGDITATYSLLANGHIEVRNACRTADGSMQSSTGEARPVAGRPGALQVRFAPAGVSWLAMVWGA